ncbi:MAG: ArnT family glycosyltransferase [Candidatus Scalindua sp.]
MRKLASLEKWLEAKEYLVFVTILFVLMAIYVAVFPGSLPLGGSDSGYYIHRANDIIIGQDNFQNYTHMIGFPLILVPLIYLLGYNFLAMHVLVIVFTIASISLCYMLLKKLGNKGLALVIMFLIGIHPVFTEYTRHVMTEMPRFFFILLGLYAVEKYTSEKHLLSKWLFVGSLSLCACLLIKPYGVIVIAAAVIRFLFIDYRKAILLGLIPAILLFLMANDFLAYVNFYLFDRWHGNIGEKPTLLQFLLKTLLVLPKKGVLASDSIFFQLTTWLKQSFHFWESVSTLIIMCPVVIGWLRHWLKKRTVVEFFVPFYIVLLIIYPRSWPRFWIYLIPFLLLYFFTGIRILVDWAERHGIGGMRSKAVIFTIITLLIITFSMVGNIQKYTNVRKAPISAEWDGFMNTCEWIKQNTPTGSGIMAYNFQWVNILTNRPEYRIMQTLDSAEQMMWVEEQRPDYLLIEDGQRNPLIRQNLNSVIKQYSNRFYLVHKTGYTRLYKVILPASY